MTFNISDLINNTIIVGEESKNKDENGGRNQIQIKLG